MRKPDVWCVACDAVLEWDEAFFVSVDDDDAAFCLLCVVELFPEAERQLRQLGR